MAGNRYLPFGYRIENGEFVLHPAEAACVTEIFDSYIQGSSYAQIAQTMQNRGVQYHDGIPAWNKHMVKRMLENRRYAGDEGYPAIITPEQYERAAEVRQNKAPAKVARKPREMPAPILMEEIKPGTKDIATVRLENQIRQELSKPVMEPERLRAMICQCAEKKYAAHFAANRPIPGKRMDAGSVHFEI